MGDINEIFEKANENYECEDCGETKRLQFGICIECGGNVIEREKE